MKKIFLATLAIAVILTGFAAGAFAAEKKGAKASASAEQVPSNYWDKWKKTISLDIFPDCGINVLGAGGDDILQATVDTYCGVKPGGYVGYVNPSVYDIYKKKGNKYPDGKAAVLVFKKIGVAFTTEFKGGQPVYDVVSIKDGKSVASKEPKHPLNPQTCATCHDSFNGVCKKLGYLCGNRMM